MNISIIGAGGHTRSLIALIKDKGYNIASIYDDSFVKGSMEVISGIPLQGAILDFNDKTKIVLSYGSGSTRRKLANKFDGQLLKENLIHKSALIITQADLGKMNQIFAGTILNAESTIGENNIINTGALIEHEVQIGSFNHISIGAIIAGRVKIGDNCFIGAGAVVIDKVKITNDVIIGANSVVIRDIIIPGTYVGNPVRKIK